MNRRCLWAGKPGCLTISTESYCPPCKRKKEAFRKAKAGHRYGASHRAAREAITPYAESGRAKCARCGLLITQGQPWHLDHASDIERLKGNEYLGPSHASCNSGARDRPSQAAAVRADNKAWADSWGFV